VARGAAQPGHGVRLDDALRSVGRALRSYHLSFDAVFRRTDGGREGYAPGRRTGSQRFAVEWSVRCRSAGALGGCVRAKPGDVQRYAARKRQHAARKRQHDLRPCAVAGAADPRADPGAEPDSRAD
jgi:hypothetical protein